MDLTPLLQPAQVHVARRARGVPQAPLLQLVRLSSCAARLLVQPLLPDAGQPRALEYLQGLPLGHQAATSAI